MDLLSLDKRLEKLKLYLEHLRSGLVRHRPQYENLMLESAEPWIEEYKPSCRGLELRRRAIKRVSQRLLAFFLITVFIITWANFLRPNGFAFASRKPESDSLILTRHLELVSVLRICMRIGPLINHNSFSKCTHWRCQIDWIEFSCFWTLPMPPTSM